MLLTRFLCLSLFVITALQAVGQSSRWPGELHPRNGAIGVAAYPLGLANPLGSALPVGLIGYFGNRWSAGLDAYIPTNHLPVKSRQVQRLRSDACIRASLRVYPGWKIDARRTEKFKGPHTDFYFGVNYWVRRRALTRYNGRILQANDSAMHYEQLNIRQTIQGGSLFAGLEAHPGRRFVLSFQAGVQVFGWKNAYGEPVSPTIVYEPESYGHYGFSTVNRPGTGGAALLHVDVQLACLLNP